MWLFKKKHCSSCDYLQSQLADAITEMFEMKREHEKDINLILTAFKGHRWSFGGLKFRVREDIDKS